ncbi:hypothetical protein CMQ_1280 [Grosmannia clavigera kw1407]|uniref:Uncharacterized protein n=1 Tax=Grosmannia clavigera (strain kw1407 / UAMH 11150) TaxID=655863 RepID=F0XCQ0_GROCL|nr:uncharacterized protein CMQ_1280 [Grosmannia clavigera kw1407]EFX04352.1 hypothetical protein CMQ_1280 [Grosmannia clavigera kw1407]
MRRAVTFPVLSKASWPEAMAGPSDSAVSCSQTQNGLTGCRDQSTAPFVINAAALAAALAAAPPVLGCSYSQSKWLLESERHERIAVGGLNQSAIIQSLDEMLHNTSQWHFETIANYVPFCPRHSETGVFDTFEGFRKKAVTWPRFENERAVEELVRRQLEAHRRDKHGVISE